MIINDTCPTSFAKRVAYKVGLYNVAENFVVRAYNSDYLQTEMDAHVALAEFQQMAIGAEFEMCLLAYHGEKLTKTQKEALEIIHKSTRPWLLGHVVGQLTSKMNSSRDKDFVSACQMILGELMENDNDVPNEQTAKKLIIKLAK